MLSSVLDSAWDKSFAPRPTTPVPDILEFVLSDKYLDRTIYPRQATLLKTIFLQKELFTQYDYDVLGEWGQGFVAPDPELRARLVTSDEDILRYDGNNGIVPDVLDRIEKLRAEDRKWFREVVSVIGRRGSKGHLGGYCGSYVTWNYLSHYNPQQDYSVDRDKRLTAFVFAAKKEQAVSNQWRDLMKFITEAPCFQKRGFIGRVLKESLTLYSQSDLDRMEARRLAHIDVLDDSLASFEILPKESTVSAGRGPASFMQFYDEMAWLVKGVANATAEEVYDSATPALDQFGADAFLYEGSSPWQMLGQFFTNWEHALQIDQQTQQAVYPEMLMVQLTSWDPYIDFESAHRIDRIPVPKSTNTSYFEVGDFHIDFKQESKHYPEIKRAIQTFDEGMQRLERANPETFAVERRSHWAAALNAYLNPDKVDAMFYGFQGERLEMQERGRLAVNYKAHGDPSKSGANFGFAIGHRLGPDANGLFHVIFDVIHAWLPSDWEDNQQDYIAIEGDLEDYLLAFLPDELTFDQFNSVGTIQRLNKFVRERELPKHIDIYERTATAPENWRIAETFKMALNMGLVHAPYFHLAALELKFLEDLGRNKVDHPTSGPIQTKDVADCLMIVTYALIGEQMQPFLHDELAHLALGGAVQGGTLETSQASSDEATFAALSNFGRSTTRSGQAGASGARYGRMRGVQRPR